MTIGAVILAGGLSRRMRGRDKGLIPLAGRPMIQWVLDAVTPQVQQLIVNANRNLDEYRQLGVDVFPDSESGHLGPLAGLLTGMQNLSTEHILMCPCDSPFVPAELVARLRASLETAAADIAVVHDGERMQPVFCLARCSLAADLSAFLSSGERKIDRWFAKQKTVESDFSDLSSAFQNINSEAELEAAELSLK